MNLYRSFGNLLESWVTDGFSDLHFQSGADVDRLDSVSRDSVPLSNVKSESEDSGFETVSSTSHSHQSSALTAEESHPVFDSTEDDVQPSSASPSVCSSSSSCVSLGSVAPKMSCQKVEKILRRTEPTSWRGAPDQMGPRHRCDMTSFLPSCDLASSRPRLQLDSPRRTHSQPPDLKKAELYRKHQKSHQHGQPDYREPEQFADTDQYGLEKLSPGLLYLEQVCRMLENIAKLQQQNHSLQKEVEILKSQHAEVESVSLHEKEISDPATQSLQILGLEDPASGPSCLKETVGFRHRSVSDTQAVSCHRRARFAQDQTIADVLVEEPDGKDSLPENEHKKISKMEKLKFTSFRRQETQLSDSKSFQTKKKTKLPNIFRSRRHTTRL